MSQEHVTLKNIEGDRKNNNYTRSANGKDKWYTDISTLGTEEKSERAAEVRKQQNTNTKISCSLFAKIETSQKMFHLLVDIGQGVVKSIERDLGFRSSSTSSTTTKKI